MDKILNHNCDGLCVHQFCGQKQTHYINIKFHGLPLALGFCEKHADIFENREFGFSDDGKHRRDEYNE